MLRLPEGATFRRLAACVFGVAGVLCFSPFGLFWLAPLVVAGLFLLVDGAGGQRAAAWLGWSFGLGFFLGGTSWVYVSLSVFGAMPWWLAAPATALFCAVLALFPALACGLYGRWRPATSLGRSLHFAGLMALAEWLRGWLFTGFPWLSLGYSQTPPSPLAGYGPLLGVYGLSLLVLLAGALLPRWRIGLPGLALLLAAGAGLRTVAWSAAVGEPVAVALVQGNIPQSLKWQPEQFLRTLFLYRDLVERHPAQLTVLPETALPAFFDQLPPDFIAELKRLARRRDGDLILGVPSGAGERYWNSAVTLGASPLQRYSKIHLVPFGEFIPPGFAWFMALARIPMSEFSRGPEDQAPLYLGGRRVAVNICYEDAFGADLRRALPEAEILINLSNTAWFGDSLAQPQHLQISALRALETGRPMLRATNTGMTAVIAPDGQVRAVLPAFTRGVLEAEVRGYQGMTPYARWGDAPFLLLAAALLLGARWRRQR